MSRYQNIRTSDRIYIHASELVSESPRRDHHEPKTTLPSLPPALSLRSECEGSDWVKQFLVVLVVLTERNSWDWHWVLWRTPRELWRSCWGTSQDWSCLLLTEWWDTPGPATPSLSAGTATRPSSPRPRTGPSSSPLSPPPGSPDCSWPGNTPVNTWRGTPTEPETPGWTRPGGSSPSGRRGLQMSTDTTYYF